MQSLNDVATFQGYSYPPVSVSELAGSFYLSRPLSLINLMGLANKRACEDSVTGILSSGPPGTKINIAILGDGFQAGDDQANYNRSVRDLLMRGVFQNDFFQERINAFNVYRVNLMSKDSGVGTKTYNNGTSSAR